MVLFFQGAYRDRFFPSPNAETPNGFLSRDLSKDALHDLYRLLRIINAIALRYFFQRRNPHATFSHLNDPTVVGEKRIVRFDPEAAAHAEVVAGSWWT